jgi:hypothetical protein
MKKGTDMKLFGYVATLGGFIVIASAAGSSEFYEQCKLAADCVAGDPPSTLGMVLQSLGGLVLMASGLYQFIQD